MAKTYQGYFHNGRFVSSDMDEVPDYSEVVIVVTGKITPPTQSRSIKGIISQYANPDLVPFEKNAWGKAAIEKHVAN